MGESVVELYAVEVGRLQSTRTTPSKKCYSRHFLDGGGGFPPIQKNPHNSPQTAAKLCSVNLSAHFIVVTLRASDHAMKVYNYGWMKI